MWVVHPSKAERSSVAGALGELPEVSVHGTSSIAPALRAIDAGPVDVVVTGAAHCAELSEAVHARAEGSRPAIVVWAADDLDDPRAHRQRCLAAGADAFLTRGAGLATLQRTVRDLAPPRRGPGDHDRFALVGRVAAGVAHDLANYLTVADMSLSLVELRAGSGRSVRSELPILREVLARMHALTETVLAYARGGAPLPAAVDLAAVVRETVQLFARALAPCTVAVDLAEVPALHGVASELAQLVLNLMLNARDAMPAGGEIQIAVGLASERVVRLEVCDRGGGLPPGTAPAAGGLAPSSKHTAPGLGLGLVSSIVERHRGTVTALARAEGGTRFVVDLPAD